MSHPANDKFYENYQEYLKEIAPTYNPGDDGLYNATSERDEELGENEYDYK